MMPLQVLEEAGDKAVLVDFYGEGSSIPPLPSLSSPQSGIGFISVTRSFLACVCSLDPLSVDPCCVFRMCCSRLVRPLPDDLAVRRGAGGGVHRRGLHQGRHSSGQELKD